MNIGRFFWGTKPAEPGPVTATPAVSSEAAAAPSSSKILEVVSSSLFAKEEPAGLHWKPLAAQPTGSAVDLLKKVGGPDARILFQIHADMFGSGSPLEGSNAYETYSYLLGYLSTLKDSPVDQELFEKLSDARALTQSSHYVIDAKALMNRGFQAGKSVIFSGGWQGSPGHSINYEFIKESDGTVTMRFYNTGAGAQFFGVIAEQTKSKTPSYCEWKGISEERILNDHFFQVIGEMSGFIKGPKREEYNEKSLFVGLRNYLQPKEVRQGVEAPLMTLQQSGVCTWRSLMAILRTYIDENIYKKFILGIKCASLVKHAEILFQDEWKNVKREERILEERLIAISATKLFHTTAKALESNLIEREEAAKIKKALEKIMERLSALNTEIDLPFERPSFVAAGEEIPNNSPLLQAPTALYESGKVDQVTGAPWSNCCDKMRMMHVGTPEDFIRSIGTILGFCEEAEKQHDYIGVHVGVHDVVKATHVQLFEGVPLSKEKAQELIVQLKTLSDHYLRSLFAIEKGDQTLVEHYYVLIKISHLQSQLSQMAGFSYSPSCSATFSALHEAAYDFFVREELMYINRIHGRSDRQEFDKHYEAIGRASYDVSPQKERNPFLLSLRKHLEQFHPKVLAAIKKRTSGYFYTTPEREEDVAIFYSEELPEWIRALRDAEINARMIFIAPIAHKAAPSLQKSFTTFKYYGDRLNVELHVAGVDQSDRKRQIKEDNSDRFSSIHRPFKSASIQEFCNTYMTRRPSLEHEVVQSASQSAIAGLTREETTALLDIFAEPTRSYQMVLEYFTKEPDKIFDPDYQQIVKMALAKAVMRGGSDRELVTFLKDQRDRLIKRRSYQPALFMDDLCLRFDIRHHSIETLLSIQEDTSLTTSERSLLYATIASQLSTRRALGKDDVVILIKSLVYLEQSPVPDVWKDPQIEHDILLGTARHAGSIREVLEQDPALIDQLFQETHQIKTSHTWEKTERPSQFPVYQSEKGAFLFHPLKGRFLFSGVMRPIPDEVRSHPDFMMLFSGITQGEVLKDGVTWIFQDRNQCETAIKMERGMLIIQQKLSDGWYEFIPSDQLKNMKGTSLIGSRFIPLANAIFRKVNNPKKWVARDKETGRVEYTVSVSRQIENVKREDELVLGKTDDMPFESASMTHFWFKSGVLKEVEFPRFHLHFFGPNLECRERPGWFWHPEKRVLELRGFSDYLFLENSRGEVQVLLPNQNLKRGKIEPITGSYSLDRKDGQLPDKEHSFHLLRMNSQGHLESRRREDMLGLGFALLTTQNYRRAIKVLEKAADKLSSYTKEERIIAERILNSHVMTDDMSANAVGIRTFTGIKLLQLHPENESNYLNTVAKQYHTWLNKSALSTSVSLRREDEIYLLKKLLIESNDPLYFNRLEELEATDKVFPVKQRKTIALTNPSDQFSPLTGGSMFRTFEHSKPEVEILSKPATLHTHFPYYFTKIMEGDQKTIEWVKSALPFIGAVEKGGTLAKIYRSALQNPNAFKEKKINFAEYTEESLIRLITHIVKEMNVDVSDLFPTSIETTETRKGGKKVSPPLSPIVLQKDVLKLQPSWGEIGERHLVRRTIPDRLEISPIASYLNEMSHSAQMDSPAKAAFLELSSDLNAFKQEDSTYEIQDLKGLQTLLLEGNTQAKENLSSVKASILDLANKLPENERAASIDAMERKHRGRRLITLKTAVMNYGTGHAHLLKKMNPALSDADINSLYKLVGRYLSLAVVEQDRDRLLKLTNDLMTLPPSSKAYQSQEALLAAGLQTVRSYDPNEHPEFLAFEYAASLVMRRDQVSKLMEFISSGELNPVMEMIMGSGKSKVLLPLLAMLKADGKRLSVLVVPQPLFDSVAVDTQASIGDAFGQQLKTLSFDRKSTFTPLSLEQMRDTLLSAKEDNQAIIMTSKSLECFLLKYIEVVASAPESREASMMTGVVQLLLSQMTLTVDEADTLLNILHIVSFSLGNVSSLSGWEMDLMGSLYTLLHDDPEIREIARLEFDRNPEKNAPYITETLYEEKLKPALISKVVRELGIAEEDREAAFAYLSRDSSKKAKAEAFFKKETVERQDQFALYAEALSSILPHTLLRNVNEHYGVDVESGSLVPIPFSGPNAPKKGSMFLSPHITAAYTFQYYLANGISSALVKKQLSVMQQQVLKEMNDDPSIDISNTDGWKEFEKMRGKQPIPLFHFTDEQVAKLAKEISGSTSGIMSFIKKFILPSLEVHDQKISCNPMNVIEFSPSTSGFTGTLWNGNSLHSSLTAVPAAGTNAKTVSILWNNSLDSVSIVPRKGLDPLLKASEGKEVQLIADAGGYCKDMSNQEIAKQISEVRGLPCIFYNDKQQQSIWIDGKAALLSEVEISPLARITFLDQSHCTGSDVPQKIDAVGVVTIGSGMLLRDLLQSVWRLRGLDKNQRVRFVISDEVAEIMRDTLYLPKDAPITFKEILSFTIVNQSRRQGKDNFSAMKAEVEAELQHLVFKVMTSQMDAAKKKKAREALLPLWIKPAHLSCRDLYGTMPTLEKKERVVDQFKLDKKMQVERFFNELSFFGELGVTKEEIFASIDSIVSRKLPFLPDLINTPQATDGDESVEVEKAEEQEQQQELEMEQQEDTSLTIHKLGHFDFVDNQPIQYVDDMSTIQAALAPKESTFAIMGIKAGGRIAPTAINLQAYFDSDPATRAVSSAFQDVDLSVNQFNWEESQNSRIPDKFYLFGPSRKPFHYVLKVSQANPALRQVSSVEDLKTEEQQNAFLTDPKIQGLRLEARKSISSMRRLKKDIEYELKQPFRPERPCIFAATAEAECAYIIQHHRDEAVKLLRNRFVAYPIEEGENVWKWGENIYLAPSSLIKLKLRFLDGESNFSKKEIAMLKDWMQKHDAAALKKLYLGQILQGQPYKTARFASSPLSKLFKEV